MGDSIGVDVGGTKVLAALVGDDGTARSHVKLVTPVDGPASVVRAIVEAVRQVDAAPVSVGLGLPGPVAGRVLLTCPNLPGFDQPVPLADMVAEELGVPVEVGNDANVGTLGEALHGAGRGVRDVLGCWLGTGVGGGLVLAGHLHTGWSGTAGELGHVPVSMDPDARLCGCGRRGCLEAYAGRAAMEQQVEDAIAAGRPTALPAIMEAKGRDRMTSGVWRRAIQDGDPLASDLLEAAVVALGAAIGGVINLIDVQAVVFGGGFAEKLGMDLVERVEAATTPRLMAPDVPRRWVLAELGDDSGVVGAAALARDRSCGGAGVALATTGD